MKYDVLQKQPLDLGTGDMFTATQIHLIEAIGKGKGNTVTALGRFFMVTKGAISQTVTQLVKMGYITRIKKANNDKEIILGLTDKGLKALEMHDRYNQATITELLKLREKFSEKDIQAFINILSDVDTILTG
jgi:DNA-binding MarR family transcriptional regulator